MSGAIITTSWDDGHPLDLNLAELLHKYDIPATFYIPSSNSERKVMDSREIREIAQHYDVGGHTMHHVNLTQISPREAKREVVEGKKMLEEIIGRELFPFSYPWGSFDSNVINIVKDAGFIGARTTNSITRRLKDPYKMSFTIAAANWGVAPYVKHSIASGDFKLFNFMLKNALFFKQWDQIAIRTLDFIIGNGGIWHLCGHSWEIDDNSDWVRLETVLHRLKTLLTYTEKVNNSQLIRMLLTGN